MNQDHKHFVMRKSTKCELKPMKGVCDVDLETYEKTTVISHTIYKHDMNQYVWSNKMNCYTQNWPKGPRSALNL